MKAFSREARSELARVQPAAPCCARAELSGMLRAAGSLHLAGAGRISVAIATEHADVARQIVQLFRTAAGLPAEVAVEEHDGSHQPRVYRVRLNPDPAVKRLLIGLGILAEDGGIVGGIEPGLVRKDCCRAAYLRGVYLMRGSVNDPRGSTYHLEIVCHSEEFAQGLSYLLNLHRLKARLRDRKDHWVVYLKDIDDIAGFLSLIGAHAALLELEEIRVFKEVRGGVNRLVNADTANLDKSVASALEQVELIEILRARGLIGHLPPALRQLALARLANPDATLAELGQLLPKPISKSAVNGRLRRLRKYAGEMLGRGMD